VSEAAALAPDEPALNRRMITISIMLATVIQALDGTIANVALPHMRARCRPPATRSPGC
jgi:DHA2 family multidrug resistance protein